MLTISLDLDLYITFLLLLAVITLLSFVFFDIYYFIRIIYIIVSGKLVKERRKVDEKLEVFGICTTTDLDLFLNHMNNARFVRELDFARLHFYQRTGIYDTVLKTNGYALQTATNIRYRRPISLFTLYKITTKIIYWDAKSLYIEHEFIGLNDGFIYAVAVCKQGFIGVDVGELLRKLGKSDWMLEKSEELEDWIKSMAKSSQRLRQINQDQDEDKGD